MRKLAADVHDVYKDSEDLALVLGIRPKVLDTPWQLQKSPQRGAPPERAPRMEEIEVENLLRQQSAAIFGQDEQSRALALF